MTLFFLRLGEHAIIAWLCLLVVLANLFVSKQASLWGLEVTCADPLSVGYFLGLNLIQEFFGKPLALKTIKISFFISFSFLFCSLFHLAYHPNIFDTTQESFRLLFTPLPRIFLASMLSFLIVQLLDLHFFYLLRQKTQGKYFTGRCLFSVLCSQVLDTVLFSFLGLYGIVGSIFSVILFSLLIKIFVIFFSTPFLWIAKRVVYEI